MENNYSIAFKKLSSSNPNKIIVIQNIFSPQSIYTIKRSKKQ